MSKRAGWAVGIGAGATLVLGSGVGLAAAGSPAAGGYIACASHTKVLAVASSKGHCPKHTTKVDVGAQGPQGKTGAKGAPGAPGSQGAVGPSAVYGDYFASTGGAGSDGGGTPPPIGAAPTVSTSGALLTLPAGSYVIRWDYVAQANSSGLLECEPVYTTGSDVVDGGSLDADLATATPVADASMQEPLVVTASTTVATECASQATHTSFVTFDVTATEAGSLNSTGFAPG